VVQQAIILLTIIISHIINFTLLQLHLIF